jgi:V-type H+-transporting ATPase subunit a
MMVALFGWMDLMIIIKWCTNYFGQESVSPSIITIMVDLFLSGGKVAGLSLFTGQRYFNNFITLLAISCVPWMLLVKPLILFKEQKKQI